jgi:hypothetical protein
MTLTQGEITNTEAGVGMSPMASDGKDRYDKVTLPRFGNYLEFNSRVKNFGFNMSSNVINSSNEHQWAFNIKSDGIHDVDVGWDHELVQKLGIGLLLWDETSQQIVNMASVGSYRTSAAAIVRIIYSKAPVNTDMPLARIGRPHPNPFKNEVTIPVTYTNTENVNVAYSILDITGRTVFVGTATSEEEGLFSITWNGRSSEGAEMPGGLYFFKITGDDNYDRKIQLEGKLIKD